MLQRCYVHPCCRSVLLYFICRCFYYPFFRYDQFFSSQLLNFPFFFSFMYLGRGLSGRGRWQVSACFCISCGLILTCLSFACVFRVCSWIVEAFEWLLLVLSVLLMCADVSFAAAAVCCCFCCCCFYLLLLLVRLLLLLLLLSAFACVVSAAA